MATKTHGAISPDSYMGRTLLALRAGPMTSGELSERFPAGSAINQLSQFGLVKRTDDHWTITDAGRAACPLRNPLAADITPVPAAATGTRPIPHTIKTQETAMTGITISGTKTPIFQAREAIAKAISGITEDRAIKRDELLARAKTDIDHPTLINVIKKMVEEKKFVGAYGHTTARRYFDLRSIDPQPVTDDKSGARDTLNVQPAGPTTGEHDAADIEFSIYNDGRLAIVDGDEVLVLPPAATRRLGYFLGCLEMNTWPPRLDPHASLSATTA